MVSNFWEDLALAKGAEDIVREKFSSLTDKYTFVDVSSQKEYFHKGDIKAIAADGREIFIEVKSDSRIAQTQNVLCEEEVFYFATGELIKGNFYSDYEIYTVVSKDERKIYVMDFSILKEHYKSGTFKAIKHWEQTTYCYLCSLAQVRSWGAMIAELEF